MKQTLLRLLWMFAFCICGLALFGFFIGRIVAWSFHDDVVAFHRKEIAAAIVGLVCFIGLPCIALFLCIRGTLPTGRRKNF